MSKGDVVMKVYSDQLVSYLLERLKNELNNQYEIVHDDEDEWTQGYNASLDMTITIIQKLIDKFQENK